MLEDSLSLKIDIMRQLQLLCQEQQEILQDAEATPEQLEDNMEKKAKLVARLEHLDVGFDQMYQKVQEELSGNRQKHKDAIQRMQDMIREITDRNVRLLAMERHNKTLAEEKFASVRTQARDVRKSSQAVSSYYQNMMKTGAVEPQFWDSKK